MLATTTIALVLTLTGQLDRVWALGLVGIGFLGLGQVFGTATALAIERVPQAAGTGSALLGTVQSLLGAIVAPLIGIGGSDTAVPLRATARCRRPRRSPPPVRIDSRHSGGRRSPRSHHLLRPRPTRKPWG
jgi:hypothetical protein